MGNMVIYGKPMGNMVIYGKPMGTMVIYGKPMGNMVIFGESPLGPGDLLAKLLCNERRTGRPCPKELPQGFSQTWQRGSLTSIMELPISLGNLW